MRRQVFGMLQPAPGGAGTVDMGSCNRQSPVLEEGDEVRSVLKQTTIELFLLEPFVSFAGTGISFCWN